LAQALNGVILPLVAVFLWFCVNDRRLMGVQLCGPLANGVLAVSVLLSCLLGSTGLLKAICSAAGWTAPSEGWLLRLAGLLVLLLVWPVARALRRRRVQ
ncbi:MAG: hypothetical protein ABIF77_04350, partial [bacterium]